MRCTRPMACSSVLMLSCGSTRRTCVASTMFSPLDPDWNRRRRTLMLGEVLKEVSCDWRCLCVSRWCGTWLSSRHLEMCSNISTHWIWRDIIRKKKGGGEREERDVKGGVWCEGGGVRRWGRWRVGGGVWCEGSGVWEVDCGVREVWVWWCEGGGLWCEGGLSEACGRCSRLTEEKTRAFAVGSFLCILSNVFTTADIFVVCVTFTISSTSSSSPRSSTGLSPSIT